MSRQVGRRVRRLVIDHLDLGNSPHPRKCILWELMNAGAPIEEHLSPRVIGALQSPTHVGDIPAEWLPDNIPGWRRFKGPGMAPFQGPRDAHL